MPLSAAGQGAAYDDSAKITYVSPSFSGFQFAASTADSDNDANNPVSVGVSYSTEIGGIADGLSVTLTAANHDNGGDGDAKAEDSQFGITLGLGNVTVTAAQYDGTWDGEDLSNTEFGVG